MVEASHLVFPYGVLPLVMFITWSNFGGILLECVGYWVSYVTSTFDLTQNLNLRFFKIKFWNGGILRTVGLIDVKRKESKSLFWILGRLCDLALWLYSCPWPGSFRDKVWNSLISGMGGPMDMERKTCESIIHDHDTLWFDGFME